MLLWEILRQEYGKLLARGGWDYLTVDLDGMDPSIAPAGPSAGKASAAVAAPS